tara:strand:- start:8 stop:136 length:129 start_codon:yes stop_codon:yes gene_type:complete
MINGVHAMIEAEKACVPAPTEEIKATEAAKTEPAVVAESAPV